MDKYNDVEFYSVPNDDECMITAVKIGEIIDEPASTIRKWAEYHEDNLYIKKINGRFAYTQKSVKQFEFIKDLKKNKGMTHEQIKQYMKEHGLQYEKFSSGLINPNDPFGYEVLSSMMAQQMEEKLKTFMTVYMEYNKVSNKDMMESIRVDVEQTVQEQLKESMNSIQNELDENKKILLKQSEENKILTDKLNSIEKELSVTKQMNEKIDYLREAMKERKEENEEIKNKSFWSKLFQR